MTIAQIKEKIDNLTLASQDAANAVNSLTAPTPDWWSEERNKSHFDKTNAAILRSNAIQHELFELDNDLALEYDALEAHEEREAVRAGHPLNDEHAGAEVDWF